MITDSEIKVGQRIKDVSVIVLSDMGGNNQRSHPSSTNGRLATITEVTEKGFKYKLDERMAINAHEWYDEGESYREGGYAQWEAVNDSLQESLREAVGNDPVCGDGVAKRGYDGSRPLWPTDVIHITSDGKMRFEEGSVWKDGEGNLNINGVPYQKGDNLINISEILRQIETAGERNIVPMGEVYKAAIILLRVIRESGADKVELIAKIMGDI